MSKNKVTIKPGDIIQLPFEGGYSYARALNHGDFAYYKYKSDIESNDIHSIINSPILLKAITNKRGFIEGIWKTIGNIPLDDSLKNSLYYLTRINSDKYRIMENDEIRDATKEECIGLPIGCIWDYIHINQLLKDHYDGNENIVLKMEDTLGNYKLKQY